METLFELDSPLDVTVRTTEEYWEKISQKKHPAMKNRLEDVKETIRNPSQVRQSTQYSDVYLYIIVLRILIISVSWFDTKMDQDL